MEVTAPPESQIDAFIQHLSETYLPGVFNPWRDTCPTERHAPGHIDRQARLRAHLACRPQVLLIGEAPGYQGCRFSGLAFTSERLLGEGAIPRIPATPRITTRPLPWSEPSATIVWRMLYELGIAEQTVMWNAFPWHPEGPPTARSGGVPTNRTPTEAEISQGKGHLARFLSLFPGTPAVALGNISYDSLRGLGHDVTKVRHPANGGAPKFREGLRAFLADNGIAART